MFIALAVIFGLFAIGLIAVGCVADKGEKAKYFILAGLAFVVCVITIVMYFNTAAGARSLKSFKSNAAGGIQRTVEVYDQQGELVKTYEGKLDVESNEYGNKVLFDLNGKRTIIYNATVIVQEK